MPQAKTRERTLEQEGGLNMAVPFENPLALDFYCGLGGWTEGLLSEGYDVIGFDIEKHDYGTGGYPGWLVLQDVLTLCGAQFKSLADRLRVIVASPPCQKYSYMAMPWTKAKKLREWYRDSEHPERIVELNELFNACFRIQREASEACGRYIPLIVENVRGAQEWVGRSAWNFGSYHLWGGDVPALMPIPHRSEKKTDLPPVPLGEIYATTGKPNACNITGTKVRGLDWSAYGEPSYKAQGFNVTAAQRYREDTKGNGSWFGDYQAQKVAQDAAGLKQGGDWFGKAEACSMSRRFSSKSDSRKAASAQIAKIPFPLARHIARTFLPLSRDSGKQEEGT